MLDCSLVYSKAQTDSFHTSSPPVSPQREKRSPREHAQSTTYQPDQVSLSLSETISTTPSSDNERLFSSGDEDSIEFRSDTAYDSVGIKTNLSRNPGLPHVDLQEFFHDPPITTANKQPAHPFQALLRRGSFSETSQVDATSLDEADSLSNPRDEPSLDQEMDLVATPVASRHTQSQRAHLTSSPPPPPDSPSQRRPSRETPRRDRSLSPRPREHLNHEDPWSEVNPHDQSHSGSTRSPSLPQADTWQPSPLLEPFEPLLPQNRPNFDTSREDKRLSIFDWSEHPRSDRESAFGSSPRPRTVHSKQVNDARTGRGPSRRPPNTLHLRSQSVPVVKESHMDNDPGYPPAKFGTWGLGHKGVSEEWTDDFVFDDTEEQDDITQDWSDTTATGMRVPQAIIDRQASVHGQFGQVQEFMLLVEGLKRLRQQGSVLNLLAGESSQLWEDAESIINLATLNDEDDQLLPPQSPTFSASFDDFDETSSPPHRPLAHFSSILSEPPTASHPLVTTDPATPPSRPRGESLAQAKTFLQTMHQSRSSTVEPSTDSKTSSSKLPFDTQDLRELVARTGAVTRALKDIVRRAEGVLPSPQRPAKEPQDPPFSQIFQKPEPPTPASTEAGLPRSTSLSSYFKDPIAEMEESDPFLAASTGDDSHKEKEGTLAGAGHPDDATPAHLSNHASSQGQGGPLQSSIEMSQGPPTSSAPFATEQSDPFQSPHSMALDPSIPLPDSRDTHVTSPDSTTVLQITPDDTSLSNDPVPTKSDMT